MGVSFALLAATVTIPPLRNFLGLLAPSLFGWGVVGASSAGAVLLSRAISAVESFRSSRKLANLR